LSKPIICRFESKFMGVSFVVSQMSVLVDLSLFGFSI